LAEEYKDQVIIGKCDVDYYVPVAEVEKLEKQHFDEINKAGLKNGN
jgi:cytochrome o ubiquinol oxidase subunit 1